MEVLYPLISPIELPRLLMVVEALAMVTPHMGRKENCLLMSKRKKNLGLKPNRNYLRQNSNKGLRLALASIVVSRAISLRLVLIRQNFPDYLWERWILKSLFHQL